MTLIQREGLQPQPARVLALLAERSGELVTRAEIQRQVWGEGTFVDFDRALNFAVMQVRTALGDEGVDHFGRTFSAAK